MEANTLVFSLFLIFSGAALLSTAALFTRQSLLVAYILLGIALGPSGFDLMGDADVIESTGEVGIIFLLFLLGLHLQPQNLLNMLRKVTWVALLSSVLFFAVGAGISLAFGFSLSASMIVGAAMMFSSTIIGLKLLPTTVLHHQHTGELMISVLLMQDLIAIAVLLALHGASLGELRVWDVTVTLLGLPVLLVVAFLAQRFILSKLFARFDRIREYMFLLSIGWCLGLAEFARVIGLSAEVGAFIAGVSIAASPIALYIAESLKPVRDFFLVMFFFSVGASFNLQYLDAILLPAVVMAVVLLVLKPVTYRVLLRQVSETKHVAWEVGMRLGQVSEFSLLIAYVAASSALLSQEASNLIQAATIITFIASSYIVVLRYPTPMALSESLRRD